MKKSRSSEIIMNNFLESRTVIYMPNVMSKSAPILVAAEMLHLEYLKDASPQLKSKMLNRLLISQIAEFETNRVISRAKHGPAR